jgi:protein-disulfide isomerase
VVKPAKKVQVQNKSRSPVKLIVGAVIVAVVGLAAVALTGGEPKPDTFDAPPSTAPVQAEGFLIGDPNAPVLVEEWADFECPGCMQFATVTEPDVRQRLVETGQVAFRYYFFPLTQIHRSAASAAYAAACAGDQGKFWEMHDAIFQGFDDWALGRARNPKNVFETYAERIGLDAAAWSECYDSDKHQALIQSHVSAGVQRGVGGTPTFFFNGVEKSVSGYDSFKAHVDEALAARPQAAAPAAPAADSAR